MRPRRDEDMNYEQQTFAPSNNIENTLRFLRDNCPPEGYLIAFSGGKDSLAVLECCKEAKVPYRYYMKITTVDPPELTKYVKLEHRKCTRLRPPEGVSLYEKLATKGFPTRTKRWCCSLFKEAEHPIERGQHLLLGMRASESNDRANNWGLVEQCIPLNSFKIAPILYWSESEVWQFIRVQGAEYCPLYDEGFDRIGCIGCPKNTRRIDGFLRWPWAYAKYRQAGSRFLAYRRANGVPFIGAWPGNLMLKEQMKGMKELDYPEEEIEVFDVQHRAEALRWQDAQDPEYLMRRVMAWWLECPVDYWKLDELERYAAEYERRHKAQVERSRQIAEEEALMPYDYYD